MAVFDASERMTGPRNHAISEGYDVVVTAAKDGRAWHQLDQPFDHDMSWQEAYMRVGAFHPFKVQLDVPSQLPGGLAQKSNAWSVVRTDPKNPNQVVELGAGLTEGYKIYDNEKLFKLAAPFIEDGRCYITSAGSLRKGTDLFICMRIKDEYILDDASGDVIKPFILFRNSHDALRGLRLTISGERSVCQNTVVSAEADQGITIRHLGDMDKNVEEAIKLIDVATQKLIATAEQYNFLKTVDVDQAELDKYVLKVLSTKAIEEGLEQIIADSDLTTEQIEQRKAEFEKALFPRMKEQIMNNFETAPGCDGKSLLSALSAVTYWTTHQRGNSDETRFRNQYFGGDSHRVNVRALRVAMELATAK